jgi:dipeptidyl aminopeptidase/acylaminoacyl peptidase
MIKPLAGALALLAATTALALSSGPAAARPFTPRDMVGLSRIASPAASSDGKWLAYQLRVTDLAANRGRTDLYLLSLDGKGGKPRLIASVPEHNEGSPVFSPDGASLYYLSNASGDDQLWRAPLAGGQPTQVTTVPGGVAGFLFSPAADKVALWTDRPVGARTIADAKPAEANPNKGSGRVYDQLFVRHWDTWSDGQRAQIFVMPVAGAAMPSRSWASWSATRRPSPLAGRKNWRGARTARPCSSPCAKRDGSSRSPPISTFSPRPPTAAARQ